MSFLLCLPPLVVSRSFGGALTSQQLRALPPDGMTKPLVHELLEMTSLLKRVDAQNKKPEIQLLGRVFVKA